MRRLLEPNAEPLWEGTVFRTPASEPYEKTVDLMLVSGTQAASEFSVLLATGQKAGRLLSDLPAAALVPGGKIFAVSRQWSIQNWNDWFFESAPKDVWILDRYEAPEVIGG